MVRARTGQLDPGEIVEVSDTAADWIHTAAQSLAGRRGDEGDPDSDELAEHAAALMAVLPTQLVRALHRYSGHGSTHNTLLIRGLLPALPDLQSTPPTTTPAVLDLAARAAALTLLGVGSVLGEPFTFASLYEGRLVQHVTPVPGCESAQTSEGSDSVLAWHVEDAFTDRRCDFVALLCLRGEPTAATRVAPARCLELDAAVEAVLREARFVVEPDLAHGADPCALAPIAVLTGPADDPELCFDAIYQRAADPDDHAAAAALGALAQAVDAAAVSHVLAPGDLLIVDNRRVAHARTLFRPRYDGSDRWLLRAMLCASRRAHRRRGAARALR